MVVTVRLLGPGDEELVRSLALDDPAFDVSPDTAEPLDPLSPVDAAAFLADPAVRYWVAFDEAVAVGQLYCVIHPIRAVPGREVLLYEISTHRDRRREGIGRRLLATLEAWMAAEGLATVWVLADDAEATTFYQACGYVRSHDQPTYLERTT